MGGGGGGLSHEESCVVTTFTRALPAVAYIQMISQQQIIRRGFSLKGTEVPTGAGLGFLWDNRVSFRLLVFYCVVIGVARAPMRGPAFSPDAPAFFRVTS
jgi:hypothetical protein